MKEREERYERGKRDTCFEPITSETGPLIDFKYFATIAFLLFQPTRSVKALLFDCSPLTSRHSLSTPTEMRREREIKNEWKKKERETRKNPTPLSEFFQNEWNAWNPHRLLDRSTLES
jgi:hypothetical protein